MMLLYRLVHQKWAAQAFDGEGARLYGGRWNSKGKACIYTAGSEALAMLEVLVHLNNRVALKQFRLFQLQLPDDALLSLSPQHLPANWQMQPASAGTANIGDSWLQEQASLALAVPSVLAPREHNILLNPSHPDYSACLDNRIELDFMPDPRLTP
ncbi:RES domain-containing protein [Alkalimonas delamerensis]|uniref:RES domain-containing protein n=1 Tax=Alkalimonas delamerensis TaxID=265981 RepID=A0ABT9GMS8_9GAMM|nr:RES domain-containing protein [Alkalimonas delamerensis]MDP4528270.1 RES domain-containing protein [Alkalimonas delamerensis]